MAALNSKFDVLRGWAPGDDACIDQSFPPEAPGGVTTAFEAGDLVTLNSSGEAMAATSPADVTLGTADPLQVYIVLEGNAIDFSGQFVNKIVCLRGKLTVQIDSTKLGAGAFAVNDAVSYNSGQFIVKPGSGLGSTTQRIGTVIANNTSTNGTVILEIDL